MNQPVLLACAPEEQAGSAHLLALWVCRLACGDLNIGEAEILWLSPTHEAEIAPSEETCFYRADDFRGLVCVDFPGTIFLRLGLSLQDVVETAAHECRHLWQAVQHGNWSDWWLTQGTEGTRAAQETDATAYAERFMRALGWWEATER